MSVAIFGFRKCSRLIFDENDVFFPLKSMYDRAHGTLEGLSAPYGTVGDVAPQGIRDLGIAEDTGPVWDSARGS